MTTPNTKTQPPLYPFRFKREGDRVRVPVHPASLPNTKFWYGTIRHGKVVWDKPDEIRPFISRDLDSTSECLMDA